MSRRVLCLVGVLATSLALPVLAGETVWVRAYTSISGTDLRAIVNSLQWAGDIIRFEQFTDSAGDPAFRMFFGDYQVLLLMYGRTITYDLSGRVIGDAYTSLQLYAGFRFSTRRPPSCATINLWNVERRQSRAYIDSDGDPCLEADLSLKGGVAADAIREWIRLFQVSLRAFATYIGW